MATTLAGENIPLDASMRNPLNNRATGAAVTSSADGRTIVLSVLTDDSESATAASFVDALKAALTSALQRAAASEMKSRHDDWWAQRWSAHYIHVQTKNDNNAGGSRLSSMYCLQRYTQITQARSPYPIKFNGMLFTANRPPLADHRDWGGLNWWQNLRLPYYNQLQAGDHEMIATLFEQFNRTLPVVSARTKSYFGFDGIWWPEYTHPLYGTTHPASYGCNRGGGADKDKQPIWHSNDRWNGYNRQGSLDLSLMILDHYAYTGDTGYLGIPVGVVEFYWNLWKNTSSAPGKPMRFFPTQAVETWQCPGWPVDPTNCPTNDMPTVAGLHSVLQKLLDSPPPGTAAATLATWTDMQGRLPPLPSRPSGGNGSPAAFIPCADCSTSAAPPAGAINCTAWNCSCQAMTDMYGSDAGIGFGCAPKDAQQWWSHVQNCKTKTATPGCTDPPAAGCGTGLEKTHLGCCPACKAPAPAPPAPPTPPPTPGCHHTSNSENAELYSVHPYRMATAARGNAQALSAAQAAFHGRTNKGDRGWNQVAMDAALIGNASEAAGYVLARAATPPAKGYRFPTFAPHEQGAQTPSARIRALNSVTGALECCAAEKFRRARVYLIYAVCCWIDYEPSSDHFGVMQNALAYMLMQLADDKPQSVVLLPAWPCSWDAKFQLHAPKHTTITGTVSSGKLSYTVSPPSREADVKAFACQPI